MDVISPQLMWIGTRCYRVNPSEIMSGSTNRESMEGYIEEDIYAEDDREEQYDIEVKDSGRFQTVFHVPAAFYGIIIGAKGQTRNRLESETKTIIQVPKQGTTGDIIITGTSRKSVTVARSRIELIIIGARNKQRPTHFLSVPLNTPDVVKRFAEFREKVVTKLPVAFRVPESLLQTPEKLHITLCMMSLMDNEDRANAAQALQYCQDSIISPLLNENGPMEICIRGLDCMNDDPHAVNVLYAKVECPTLQAAANRIYEYFISKGLTCRQYDQVKLHATLINSHFVKRNIDNVDEKKANSKQIPFDASEILRLYGDFNFGKMMVNEIHLSQRFTTSSTGYYEATAIIKV